MNIRLITTAFVLIATSVLNSATAADNQKASPRAKQECKQSPKQTVAAFFRHLTTGETRKAKEVLFMPINDQRVAAQIDDILLLIAKQKKKNGKVHVFDSHTLKNMAIVVYGTEGKRFADNIDIDPIFLRDKDGKWKIVFANSADDLKEHELPDDVLRKRADELLAWYKKREPEVRADWRKKQKKEKTKESTQE